jgi:hypothetical protein
MSDAGASGLPADVLQLVADRVEGMQQVEIVLLLRGEEARAWRSDEIALKLRADMGAVARDAAALAERGILSSEPGPPLVYRYAPATRALRDAVDGLAEAYNSRPVTLVKAIYDRPAPALRSFADAFRIRKPDKGA